MRMNPWRDAGAVAAVFLELCTCHPFKPCPEASGLGRVVDGVERSVEFPVDPRIARALTNRSRLPIRPVREHGRRTIVIGALTPDDPGDAVFRITSQRGGRGVAQPADSGCWNYLCRCLQAYIFTFLSDVVYPPARFAGALIRECKNGFRTVQVADVESVGWKVEPNPPSRFPFRKERRLSD